MTEVQRKTLSEASVVHQFLDPFFRARPVVGRALVLFSSHYQG